MDSAVDRRIVQMEFDNDQFEKGIKESIRSLDELKKALELDKAAQSLDNLDRAVSSSMKNIEASAESMASSLERILDPIDSFVRHKLESVISAVENAGERLVKAISIDAMRDGLSEYEELTKTSKTITNMVKNLQAFGGNEPAAFSAVTAELNELNEYADRTIYSFQDMTGSYLKFVQNLGDDTSVEQATKDVEGLFNAAAYYGLNKTQAQSVARNTGQAMGLGYMGMRDWWSFVNAGMASKDFQSRIIQAAKEVGTLNESGHIIGATGKAAKKAVVDLDNFNDTLQFKWFDKRVMERVFQLFADGSTQLGQDAMEAATKVRTFSDMMSSLKEALGTGWASTFTFLFGDMYTIEERLTSIKDTIEAIINYTTDRRNKAVQQWLDTGSYKTLVPTQVVKDEEGKEQVIHWDEKSGINSMTDSVKNLGAALLNAFGLFDLFWEAAGKGFKTGFANSIFKQGTDLLTVLGITPESIENATAGLADFTALLYDAFTGTKDGEWFRDSTYADILHIFEGLGAAFGFVTDAVTPFLGLIDDVLATLWPVADITIHITAILSRLGGMLLNRIRELGLFEKAAKVLEIVLAGIRLILTLISDALRSVANWIFDSIYFDKLGKALRDTWTKLKTFGKNLIDNVKNSERFKKAWTTLQNNFTKAKNKIVTAIKGLTGEKGVLTRLSKWFENFRKQVSESEVVQKWKNKLTEVFTNLAEKLPEVIEKINGAFDKVSGWYKNAKEWVKNNKTIQSWKNGLTEFFTNLGTKIPAKIDQLFTDPVAFFAPLKEWFTKFLASGLELFGVENPEETATKIVSDITGTVKKIKEGITEVVTIIGSIFEPVEGAENMSLGEELEARFAKLDPLFDIIRQGINDKLLKFLTWIGIENPVETAEELKQKVHEIATKFKSAFEYVFTELKKIFEPDFRDIPSAVFEAYPSYGKGKDKPALISGEKEKTTFLEDIQKAMENFDLTKIVEEIETTIDTTVTGALEGLLKFLGDKNPAATVASIKEQLSSFFKQISEIPGIIAEEVGSIFKRRPVMEQVAKTIPVKDGFGMAYIDEEVVGELPLFDSALKNIQDKLSGIPTWFEEVKQTISDTVFNAFAGFLSWLGEENPEERAREIVNGVRTAFGNVAKILGTIGDVIVEVLTHRDMKAATNYPETPPGPFMGRSFAVIEEPMTLGEQIKKNVSDALSKMPGVVQDIKDGIRGAMEGIAEALGSDDPSGDVQWIIDSVNTVFGKISELFTAIIGWVHKIFGGGTEKGEVTELEESLEGSEERASSISEKIQNVIGLLLSPFFASAVAEEADPNEESLAGGLVTALNNTNKDLKDSEKTAGKTEVMSKTVGDTISGFAQNMLGAFTDGEFSIDKLLNVAGRAGFILGGTSLATGVGNLANSLANTANIMNNKKGIFNGGTIGIGQFTEFVAAMWLATDSLTKLTQLNWGQVTSALGKMFGIMALMLAGKTGDKAIDKWLSKDAGRNKKSGFNFAGILAFAAGLSIAVGAITGLLALDLLAPGKVEAVEKAIEQFISIMGSLLLGDLVVNGAHTAFSVLMKQFGTASVGMTGFKDFCKAISDCVGAIAILTGVNALFDAEDIANALQQFFEIFTVGGFTASMLAFVTHWSAFKSLGSGLQGFKDFASAVRDITESVMMLLGANLLDEIEDVFIETKDGVKKTNLVAKSLADLLAVMVELDIGAFLGTWLQNIAVDKGGNKVDANKAMKSIKTFAEAMTLITGAFVAIVGIESMAKKEDVEAGLKHLAVLMGLLTGAEFLTSLGDALGTAIGGGATVDWKKKLADFAGIALALLASVGSFWLLANMVESFDESTIDKAIEIMAPLSLLLGSIGSIITVMDKLHVDTWTAGAQLGVNTSELFGILYTVVNFMSWLGDASDTIVEGLTRGEITKEKSAQMTQERMKNFGATINAFFSGLLGIKDITDPEEIRRLAQSLNTLGDEMATVNWDRVNPALNSLMQLSVISNNLNNIGKGGSGQLLLSDFGTGIKNLASGVYKAQESLTKLGGINLNDFSDLYAILSIFSNLRTGEVLPEMVLYADTFDSFTEDLVAAVTNMGTISGDIDNLYKMVDIFDKCMRLMMIASSDTEGTFDKDKVESMVAAFDEFGTLAHGKGSFEKAGTLVGEFMNGFSSVAEGDASQAASDALKLIEAYTDSLNIQYLEGGKVFTAGVNFAQGFADGITANQSAATSAAEAMGALTLAALNLAVGNHSPSWMTENMGEDWMTEYMNSMNTAMSDPTFQYAVGSNSDYMSQFEDMFAGYDLKSVGMEQIVSLAKGIIDNQDEPVKSGEQVAIAVRDEVGTYRDALYPVGVDFAIGFANGVCSEEGLTQAAVAGQKLAQSVIDAVAATGIVESPSHVMFGIGDFFAAGFANGILNRMGEVRGNSESVASSAINSMDRALNGYSMLTAMGIDPNPVIRPVLDLSDIQMKTAEMDRMFGDFNLGRAELGADIGRIMQPARSDNSADLYSAVREINSNLVDLQSRMNNLQVILDTGVLVGQLTPGIDHQLGANYARGRRGV